MQHPGDGECREDDEQGAREEDPPQARACLAPRGVPGFPEEHDGKEDLQNHMRRQADLAHLVQLVRGDERQHQAQEYEQNGGRDAHPMGQDVA